jgi:hypothetical protein
VNDWHVVCRIKGPQGNVLIVRQQQENVVSFMVRIIRFIWIRIIVVAVAVDVAGAVDILICQYW